MVDWSPLAGRAERATRLKRWVYAAVTTRDLYLAVAVVHLGYAASAFAYAYDGASRRILARRSWMGAPQAASVRRTAAGESIASWWTHDAWIRLAPAEGLEVDAGDFRLDVELDAKAAPPAIGAVARVAPGRYDATEKRALLAARGTLRVGGRTLSLDGGLAGYDFTSGLLARHTRWRWGFALGWTQGGEPFGLNLVQGFVGEAECAAWWRSELVPLAEGELRFDERRPASPWRVRTVDGAADLTMTPGTVHEERKNLLLVRSRFAQPCGAWSGAIALEGRSPLVIDRALGVTEDQDVTW